MIKCRIENKPMNSAATIGHILAAYQFNYLPFMWQEKM